MERIEVNDPVAKEKAITPTSMITIDTALSRAEPPLISPYPTVVIVVIV